MGGGRLASATPEGVAMARCPGSRRKKRKNKKKEKKRKTKPNLAGRPSGQAGHARKISKAFVLGVEADD